MEDAASLSASIRDVWGCWETGRRCFERAEVL